jgi:hypothetical protein
MRVPGPSGEHLSPFPVRVGAACYLSCVGSRIRTDTTRDLLQPTLVSSLAADSPPLVGPLVLIPTVYYPSVKQNLSEVVLADFLSCSVFVSRVGSTVLTVGAALFRLSFHGASTRNRTRNSLLRVRCVTQLIPRRHSRRANVTLNRSLRHSSGVEPVYPRRWAL